MKTLIAYYSFTGNNEALAKSLQLKLDCDIYEITEVNKRKSITILFDLIFKRLPKVIKPTIELNQYDHIIFISPVWDGKIATPLKSFLINERSNIYQYSFITICSGRRGQYDWLRDELIKVMRKEPSALTELKVNDLLPPEKRDNIKYTTPYRVQGKDIAAFYDKIDPFLKKFKTQEQPVRL